MWKKILEFGHMLGFTNNEATVILFLTGAITAGAALNYFRGIPDTARPDYREVYRVHDSIFAARSNRIIKDTAIAKRDAASPQDSLKATDSTVLFSERSGAEHPGKTRRPVNINSASQTELESLPGIGPATAKKIIEYRKSFGKFKVIGDIMNVPRIGPKKFEQMKSLLSTK